MNGFFVLTNNRNKDKIKSRKGSENGRKNRYFISNISP